MKRVAASLLALALVGCNQQASKDAPAAGGDTAVGAELCTADQTAQQVKQLVFRAAGDVANVDPVLLNDLAMETTATISGPVLQGVDEALKRTSCAGRLSIALPASAQPLFGRDKLQADIQYSVQPAADNSGPVYQATGTDPIVTALSRQDLTKWRTGTTAAAAPSTAAPAQPAASAPAAATASQPTTVRGQSARRASQFQPSFDCARASTRVEHLICGNESLSRLDRQMAAVYRAERNDPNALARQRAWLQKRNACTTEECLHDVYALRVGR
ncbi:hypothetical protein [uncultured Brevundimonas sp.]|uniref:lysozyme inhibitor LprI family protein n=1 Tax=uncultured Brevundimonas sp. TaxID=213418 RepID=UPI00260F6A91|nr:hypothetical protein [uncultured Brevundimonas sp.]